METDQARHCAYCGKPIDDTANDNVDDPMTGGWYHHQCAHQAADAYARPNTTSIDPAPVPAPC